MLSNAIVLALAWFTAVNAAISICSLVAARLVARRAAPRAGALLAIRLLPAATSLLFVAAFFAPAHWRFEPRGVQEAFGLTAYALAAAGAWLLARSAWRALRLARAGHRLRSALPSQRIGLSTASGAHFYEAPGLPGVSLAGVLRPRIVISPEARASLTPAELEAAVAHEIAHRAAFDNVKRFAMLCAPDLLAGSTAMTRLEEQWRSAAECDADARAARGDPSRAVHLASALVKVASLGARADWRPSPAWSTLHDAPLLERRVKRLLAAATPSADAPRPVLALAAGALALLGITALGTAAASRLHGLTETLAHLLP